jgi:hypothetical protein
MQREAVEETIAALRSRLGPEHAAVIEAARGLADAVDKASTRASLWQQYRESLGVLLDVGAEEGVDDETAGFLSIVRPAVGDCP